MTITYLDNSNEPFLRVKAHYEKYITLLSPSAAMEIQEFLVTGTEDALICYAIDIAVDNNARKWPYIRRIIDNCIVNGIMTLGQYRLNRANLATQSNQSKKPIGSGNPFLDMVGEGGFGDDTQ